MTAAAGPCPPTWLVGRGLLGGAIARALARAGAPPWQPGAPLPWDDPARLREALAAAAAAFAAHAGPWPWRLLWCAGAGVVGTPAEALRRETAALEALLEAVARRRPPGPGALFLASSAGGVYAGSPDRPPFTEASAVGARSDYGAEKLRQEALAGAWARAHGVALLVGRLSNLYGPGQDLGKPQGLISQACRAALRRQPLTLWVPLDTIRDYLFVDDAARLVVAGLARLEAEARAAASPPVVVRLLASEVDTSVAAVVGTFRRLLRRAPPLRFAVRAATRLQPRDLRFRSTVWRDLHAPPTPLHVGIHAVLRDLLLAPGAPRPAAG